MHGPGQHVQCTGFLDIEVAVADAGIGESDGIESRDAGHAQFGVQPHEIGMMLQGIGDQVRLRHCCCGSGLRPAMLWP